MQVGQDLVGVDCDSSAISLVLSDDGTSIALGTPYAYNDVGKQAYIHMTQLVDNGSPWVKI